jgi:hypothetical protein
MLYIGPDALVEVVGIGIAQMLADLDGNLAKEGHGAGQGLPVIG